jgi:hypothetical protein
MSLAGGQEDRELDKGFCSLKRYDPESLKPTSALGYMLVTARIGQVLSFLQDEKLAPRFFAFWCVRGPAFLSLFPGDTSVTRVGAWPWHGASWGQLRMPGSERVYLFTLVFLQPSPWLPFSAMRRHLSHKPSPELCLCWHWDGCSRASLPLDMCLVFCA